MLQINSDDSDCVIEDTDITCITLDDSQDGVKLNNDNEEIPPAPKFVSNKSMQQDLEEGEVSDEDEDEEENDDNICEIKFNNQNKFKKFSKIIIDNLKDKLNDAVAGKKIKIITKQNQDAVTLTVMYLSNNDIEDIPMPPSLREPSPINIKPEHSDKESSPDLSGISELFKIDTEPAAKLDSVTVPSYKRAIKDALLDEEAAAHKKQKQDEDSLKKVKTNSCFNCGDSGHSIRDCQKPHNSKRIKNARRMIFKAERYHVDVEQRFSHLKPGCLSQTLRDALGLRKGELPFFFYRMRVMGYPPGWLEDAKVEQSGITLFNSDGTKILHSDEDETEVDQSTHKYNIEKIVDFPGFNQDPGENFFDDYKYHQVPPFDKNQLKDEFVKTLGDTVLKAYKRKKLKDFPNANNNNDSSVNDTSIHETADMDIEDPESIAMGNVEFTRPKPPPEIDFEIKPPPPPTTPPPETKHNKSQTDILTPSPTLLELVKKKRKLLQQLKADTSVTEIDDSLIDEIISLDEDCSQNDIEKNTSLTDVNNLDKQSNSNDQSNKTSDNNNTDIIKESFMGTPVLKFSPYDNLPNGDNFRVGVSDVINFENLPDSTGKYEQMKKVIKKVRHVIHKIQSED